MAWSIWYVLWTILRDSTEPEPFGGRLQDDLFSFVGFYNKQLPICLMQSHSWYIVFFSVISFEMHDFRLLCILSFLCVLAGNGNIRCSEVQACLSILWFVNNRMLCTRKKFGPFLLIVYPMGIVFYLYRYPNKTRYTRNTRWVWVWGYVLKTRWVWVWIWGWFLKMSMGAGITLPVPRPSLHTTSKPFLNCCPRFGSNSIYINLCTSFILLKTTT